MLKLSEVYLNGCKSNLVLYTFDILWTVIPVITPVGMSLMEILYFSENLRTAALL